MKRVQRYQTRDGKLHDTLAKARRHAEVVYGEALSKIAHRLVHIEKYSDFQQYIEDHLDDFVRLKELKSDAELENPEDDDDD